MMLAKMHPSDKTSIDECVDISAPVNCWWEFKLVQLVAISIKMHILSGL